MKKCPSCERTFEDNMRFCQSDGTPLVNDAPPVDPYKTMVASSEEIKAAMPSAAVDPPKQDDEVLQLPPEADPKKTMYASEEEIRQEMAAREEPVMDLPLLSSEPPAAPEPPKFSEPSLSPPSFAGTPSAPPPSPLSGASEPPAEFSGDPFAKTTPPIPSPFDKPKPTTFEPPPSPNFSAISEQEPVGASLPAPFDPAPPAVEGSASAPVQNWEPNQPMQNAPVSGPQGQNKTLAIVSLVAGILGVTLCCGTLVPSLVAIITGFMARGKATSDPMAYGGAGLALGGLITGVLGLLGGIAYLVFIFFFGGMQLLMQGAR